ncbi:hypothetical protein Salat_1394200 [Sesamum alatum]|uniref:Uncharacterized protein n=1 Tax=Sesamum alatum TaxID=300844 RepID=A0AAE2CL62_9LAMI|nr:hypothetical protein Salat_1394200 [Sesamum alatum]
MEKPNANHRRRAHAFLHFAAALALVLALGQKAECLSTAPAAEGGCNGTRIADCLPDGEEFLMESETSRRLLLDGHKTITPQTLVPVEDFCDANAYGSCYPGPNQFYDSKKRVCNYPTCKRHA